MINVISYFINESEKEFLKGIIQNEYGKTFTVLKKFDTKNDSHESLVIFNEDEKVIANVNTNKFAHLAINKPYLITKDSF